MRTLMVTPYAPYRDGIATYAVQEVRMRRAEGEDLEVLSPNPSAAHHHLGLGTVRGVAALAKRASSYDKIIVQFSPEMLFGGCRGAAQRVAVWSILAGIGRLTELELRLHEIEYGPLEQNPAERKAAAAALRSASSLEVHTEAERGELSRRLGVDLDRFTLVDHGERFVPAVRMDRSTARSELGLPNDHHIFLSIGFLQEHKGFDLAVEAFSRASAKNASLHVVGSVRVDHPELLDYARRLEQICWATPGVTLHRRFVSDEEFDTWLSAADTLVLPYREIWSSGVLERAKLFDLTVIAADVGGIGDQAGQNTVLFSDPDGLVSAIRGRLPEVEIDEPAGGDERRAGSDWKFESESPTRAEIEQQIRTRARARAGQIAEVGDDRSPVDALLSIGSFRRPMVTSARPGVSAVKGFVQKLTGWQFEPLAEQIERLQAATLEAVARLEDRKPVEGGEARVAGEAESAGVASTGSTCVGSNGAASPAASGEKSNIRFLKGQG